MPTRIPKVKEKKTKQEKQKTKTYKNTSEIVEQLEFTYIVGRKVKRHKYL